MAYKIRASGKTPEFKKTDELLPALDSLGDSFRKYGAPLLIAAGLLLLIGGAVWGFIWYQGQQENAASGLVYQASNYFHQIPDAAPDEKTPAPTREENLKKAIELFGEVIAQYPRTHSASISQYYIGNTHLELGQYDEAVADYQTFLDRFQPSDVMAGLALQRMGLAYQAKGDKASAEASFEKVLSTDKALNKDQVLFLLGLLLEDQNKKEEAITQYKRIIQEYPLSVLIPDTRTRLRGLGFEPEQAAPAEDKPESSAAPPANSENGPAGSDGKK